MERGDGRSRQPATRRSPNLGYSGNWGRPTRKTRRIEGGGSKPKRGEKKKKRSAGGGRRGASEEPLDELRVKLKGLEKKNLVHSISQKTSTMIEKVVLAYQKKINEARA